MEAFADFFRQLAEDYPRWNFIFFHDARQWARVVSGIYYTVVLSIACVIFSVIIGVVGAWLQGSSNAWLRWIVQGYIQFFRNTPPFVQLLFFYFALGQFTPTVTGADGWTEVPLISNVGWAIISLSFFAGAFNVEIAGLHATTDLSRGRLAARVSRLIAIAEQQSGQPGQDDDTGDRYRRARASL
jgi:polar amino acid transport system permease protein